MFLRHWSTLDRSRRLTVLGTVTFIACLVTVSAFDGLPLGRDRIFMWITFAVFTLGAGNLRRSLRDFVTRWVPVFFALFLYDLMRGRADSLQTRAHLEPQLGADKLLGAGQALGQRMQAAMYTPGHPQWYDYLAWATYTSHFVLPLGIAVVLWKTSRARFSPYMLGIALLSYMALATYAIYPAQPPWMASQEGHAGPIARVVHDMWRQVGVQRAAHVFSTKPAGGGHPFSNPVAALPSLHASFPMLSFMALRGLHRWLDVTLLVYVVAMGWALVYAGEHYVLDIVMGWCYAVVAWYAVQYATQRVRGRRAARRARATVTI